jgi:rhodanese-related sulfurtransferase
MPSIRLRPTLRPALTTAINTAPAEAAHAARRTALRRGAGALLAAALALPLAGCNLASATDVATLEEARAAHEAGRALLVDIREPEEHATGVAAGALLLPLRQMASRLQELPRDPQRPLLLICATQNRSSRLLRMLRERGFSDARYVDGGMSGWRRRGWPLVAPGAAATPPG